MNEEETIEVEQCQDCLSYNVSNMGEDCLSVCDDCGSIENSKYVEITMKEWENS